MRSAKEIVSSPDHATIDKLVNLNFELGSLKVLLDVISTLNFPFRN